jgi:hypothetical protein
MSCSDWSSSKKSRIGRFVMAAVAISALSLTGCTSMDLRGEPFHDDSLSGTARQLRPRETNSEPWGVSNKARQIEQDFGY